MKPCGTPGKERRTDIYDISKLEVELVKLIKCREPIDLHVSVYVLYIISRSSCVPQKQSNIHPHSHQSIIIHPSIQPLLAFNLLPAARLAPDPRLPTPPWIPTQIPPQTTRRRSRGHPAWQSCSSWSWSRSGAGPRGQMSTADGQQVADPPNLLFRA